MKKGQVSLFVLLGLVILILIIGVYFIFTQLNPSSKTFTEISLAPEEVQEIAVELESCLDLVATDSLIKFGENGGLLLEEGVNNWLTKSIPDETFIHEQFVGFFQEYVPYCLFYVDYRGYNVTYEEIKTDITLTEDRVKIEIIYPLTLTNDFGSYIIDTPFFFEYDVPLQLYLDIASEVVENYELNGRLCLSCLSIASTENNLNIQTYFEESTLVIIEDGNVKFNQGEVYYFAFTI